MRQSGKNIYYNHGNKKQISLSDQQVAVLTRALPPPTLSGLLTRVMVFVTPPTTVVTTWACCETVTVPDLWTVMIGRLGIPGVETTEAPPTWAAAVFSIRVAGLVTWDTQGEKTCLHCNMTDGWETSAWDNACNHLMLARTELQILSPRLFPVTCYWWKSDSKSSVHTNSVEG